MLQVAEFLGIPREEALQSPTLQNYNDLPENISNKLCKALLLRYSVNTLSKNFSYSKKYFDFCVKHKKKCLPTKQSFIEYYLLQLSEKDHSYSSIECYLDGIKFSSSFFGFTNQFSKSLSDLRFFLKKVCKLNKSERKGLDKEMLDKIWKKVNNSGGIKNLSALDLRTFMHINFSYHTLARYDCASQVKIGDLKFKNDHFEITIRKSKTDQAAEGQKVYLVSRNENCPMKMLCHYIQHLNVNDKNSYLFSPLKWDKAKKEWIPNSSKVLSYTAAYKNFKQFLTKFNLDPKNLSLHSMRIGSTTDCFNAKMPSHIIDQRGRWKHPDTKYRYVKNRDQDIIFYTRQLC